MRSFILNNWRTGYDLMSNCSHVMGAKKLNVESRAIASDSDRTFYTVEAEAETTNKILREIARDIFPVWSQLLQHFTDSMEHDTKMHCVL